MEDFIKEGKTVGLVLDLSLRHDANGERILDVVKKKLVEIVRNSLEDDVDSLYLYHPDLVEVLYNHGDQISAISNYETDGWQFNVEAAMKQTMYVVAGEDRDNRKYLILITDRLIRKSPINKALFINEKDHLGCNLVVIGVGDRYDKNMLDQMAKINSAIQYFHISQPFSLADIFPKESNDGRDCKHQLGNDSIQLWNQNICDTSCQLDQ